MDFRKERSLLEASSLYDSRPLALCDFLDQKPSSRFPPYSYQLEMSRVFSAAQDDDNESPPTTDVETSAAVQDQTPLPQAVPQAVATAPQETPNVGPVPDDNSEQQGQESRSGTASSQPQEFYSPQAIPKEPATRDEPPPPIPARDNRRPFGRSWIHRWADEVADSIDELYCCCGDTQVDWPVAQDPLPRRTSLRSKNFKSMMGLSRGSKSPAAGEGSQKSGASTKGKSPRQDPDTEAGPSSTVPPGPPSVNLPRPGCGQCGFPSAAPITPPPTDDGESSRRKKFSVTMKSLFGNIGNALLGHGKKRDQGEGTRGRARSGGSDPTPIRQAHQPRRATGSAAPRVNPLARASLTSFRTAKEGSSKDEEINLNRLDELDSGEEDSPRKRSIARLRRAQNLLDRSHPPPQPKPGRKDDEGPDGGPSAGMAAAANAAAGG